MSLPTTLSDVQEEPRFPEEVGKTYILHFMASKGDVFRFEQTLEEISLDKKDILSDKWSRHEVLPEPYLSLINWRDGRENVPLHWATHGKKLDMAEQMVKWGANPQAKNYADVTPLEQLMRSGQTGVALALKWIEEGRINPHLEFQTGRGSWFHVLISTGPCDEKLILALFDAFAKLGVDIDVVNQHGEKMDDASFLNRFQIQGELRDKILIGASKLHLEKIPQATQTRAQFRL